MIDKNAVEIIDGLLLIFRLAENKENYSIVRDALFYLAQARNEDPNQPLTLAIAMHLREKGMIK